MTKDEIFLIALYKKSCTLGDNSETLDPYLVGNELGYNERLVNTLLRGLLKANFVKRLKSDEIVLTSRGEALAKSLL